ncbi:DUF2726 domain-containing protein [Psychrobacter sp. UBA3962]|uniref:DUF2726 domain-containing protein n=1 Tax=Psychrobacter sp. UBA3962 TaxID=1947352 RepID=UPI0025F8B728|nr:DUF2726 domain-containing protein [Psychrobacter sp. UBA3962]
MMLGVMVLVALIIMMSIIAQRRHDNKKQKPVKGDELAIWPFEPMPIMTDTEVLFFAKLQQAVPEYYIFSQVQLSRIIAPSEEAGTDKNFWFNRICRQSVDYVLVDRDAQTTLLAIELDDWTHDSVARQKADDKKDKALASAGIPILRFHAERMPSVSVIRHDVEAVISKYFHN